MSADAAGDRLVSRQRSGPGKLRGGRGRISGSLLLLAVIVLFAFPLVSMILAPLRQPGLPPPPGLELIPANPSLRSYADAFTLVPLGRAVINSAFVALIAVPITIVTASWAGLAMTLMSGWRLRLLVGALLVLALVPVTAVWIPRFVLFDALELVGTYVPLVAPTLMGGSPLFVLLYVVALRRIPPELFEAARMEGVGPFRIWWSVALPLVKPTTTAIGLLSLVLFWSNFIDPLLYLKSERDLTAPPMLHQLEPLGPTNWPVFLAGAVVVTVPVIAGRLVDADAALASLWRSGGALGLQGADRRLRAEQPGRKSRIHSGRQAEGSYGEAHDRFLRRRSA